MATPFTHALVAATAAGACPKGMPLRFWLLAVLCSTLPDVDCIGFRLGIEYGHLLGHRGLTHSLSFALAVSVLVCLLAFRDVGMFGSPSTWRNEVE